MGLKRLHQRLLAWYAREKRDLPWRRTKDPYRIWISEIMLQQTRVETVIPYFERFLASFPDAGSLAKAGEDQLLNLWAGLGYYSRARNLQAAARQVMEQFDGRFPSRVEDLRSLKGVGPYTSAAIASIAFGQPHAAIDGNLERVISRLLGCRSDPKREGKPEVAGFADALVALGSPGEVNQALMDLASAVCLPRAPDCSACPLVTHCKAFELGEQKKIPLRRPKPPPLLLQAHGLVLLAGEELLLARRPKGQWLAGMWDIPWWIEGRQKAPRLPEKSSHFATSSHSRTITKHKIQFEVQGFHWQTKPRPKEFSTLPGAEFRWVRLADLHGINLPRPSEKALESTLSRLDFSLINGGTP
jgi:A/G-specific adenine glycosylase